MKQMVRMANACDPGIQEWKQEDPEFKDNLSHRESLKSIWATKETVWEEEERREEASGRNGLFSFLLCFVCFTDRVQQAAFNLTSQQACL